MKIFKLYGGKTTDQTFSFQGLKTLRRDGVSRNDLQTAMAVIQWLTTIDTIKDVLSWLWDDNQCLRWDDDSPILLG